jgi:hypothetical protein
MIAADSARQLTAVLTAGTAVLRSVETKLGALATYARGNETDAP